MPRAKTKTAPVVCASCGRSVERKSRQQTYCSDRCRRKKGRQRAPRPGMEPTARTGREPKKSSNKINDLRGQKWRARQGIYAPADLIEAELFSGKGWQAETSTDGVTCLVWRRRGAT